MEEGHTFMIVAWRPHNHNNKISISPPLFSVIATQKRENNDLQNPT
jgi:hypothetical protein